MPISYKNILSKLDYYLKLGAKLCIGLLIFHLSEGLEIKFVHNQGQELGLHVVELGTNVISIICMANNV